MCYNTATVTVDLVRTVTHNYTVIFIAGPKYELNFRIKCLVITVMVNANLFI